MILLCGIPSEPPLRMALEQLRSRKVPFLMFNQRDFSRCHMRLEIDAGRVSGELAIDEQVVALQDISAVYNRLMDDRALPEIQHEPLHSSHRRHCQALHETLLQWLEVSESRVVNRASAMASNSSKPYQTQLIRESGFAIPATLITNDPELVADFRRQHGRVIYKSTSGVRSIVKSLDDEALEHLERIRWCPVQFQEYVDGTDVRVHVIGEVVHATAIQSDVDDYRYASREGKDVRLTPAELEEDVAAMCVRLASELKLPFCGVDLRIAPDGQIFCFEVNPSPAFSYYQSHAGQPIAETLVDHLCAIA